MSEKESPPVIVLGATNRPDALDTGLRTGGRFAKEISIGIPDEAARASILHVSTPCASFQLETDYENNVVLLSLLKQIQPLQVLSRGLKLSGDFDFNIIAHKTPGYAYICHHCSK